MKKTESGSKKPASCHGGKFLTFRLGVEEYGLEILKVKEIIGLMAVTKVPRTPEYVRGVINLRGKVIPVITLRAKFNMERVADTEETCIIVTSLENREIGIVVDRVSEVADINESEIENPPDFDSGVQTDFILGIGKTGNRVIILLDISKVLTGESGAVTIETEQEVND